MILSKEELDSLVKKIQGPVIKDFHDQKLHLELITNLFTYDEEKKIYKTLEKLFNNPPENKRVNQTYGDDGLIYRINFYGKITERPALSWSKAPLLKELRDYVSDLTGEKYTICVVQRYPNGKIGINPHRDKEMILGTTIAGMSFGTQRTLTMQRGEKNISLDLTPGSLYVMKPPTNSFWSHSIEKDNTTGVRISLTFRNYQNHRE
jgi:alkylated DNA repair dioxygenase AlkB